MVQSVGHKPWCIAAPWSLGSILLSTVSNFLDFFKIEAGKALDIVRCEVDLTELVSDVHCIIDAMVGRSGEVNLLHPQLCTGLTQHVTCDPDRVKGILLNLYTNAVKFTRAGHVGLRVREVGSDYTPEPEPGYFSVTVTPSYLPCKASHHRSHNKRELQPAASLGPTIAPSWVGSPAPSGATTAASAGGAAGAATATG
ncbi:uncharacterized protein HaLaN_15331 [Haematococcus lacustris]|uniref:histidine kinase n=1 Tax=Haematococcus lacustris TaxID=44745 RepID=A0A699ZRE7_HAELA|nr:uncharacterized protein HaLaN_15331 [Haematococcus lacustris]